MLFVGCDQTLFVTFSAEVLSTFQEQQQVHFWQRERGGLLFARSVGQTDGCAGRGRPDFGTIRVRGARRMFFGPCSMLV